MDNIKILWEEFKQSSYPDKAHISDFELLDGTIAGCIASFLQNNGSLDEERTQLLTNSLNELQEKINQVPDNSKEYFLKLHVLGNMVIKELNLKN